MVNQVDILHLGKNLELFRKQFPNHSVEELQKLEKYVAKLYEESIPDVRRIVDRGFTEDYKNIVYKEWFLFITKMVPRIERFRGIKLGKERLELLIAFAIFIIINLLPIDLVTKQLLITIIQEFIPEIAEGLIYVSKKIHTLFSRLMKTLKNRCCKSKI